MTSVVQGCACIVVRLVHSTPYPFAMDPVRTRFDVTRHLVYIRRVAAEFKKLQPQSLRMLVPCTQRPSNPETTNPGMVVTTMGGITTELITTYGGDRYKILWDTPETTPAARRRFLFDHHPLDVDTWPYESDMGMRNAIRWNEDRYNERPP